MFIIWRKQEQFEYGRILTSVVCTDLTTFGLYFTTSVEILPYRPPARLIRANYRGQPKAGTGHKMLFVPFVFFKSRFQGPSFPCNRIVVIVTLLEAIEGIPDSTKIIIFEGTKTSTIFTRDYFMSENLRVDI